MTNPVGYVEKGVILSRVIIEATDLPYRDIILAYVSNETVWRAAGGREQK